MFGFRTPAKAPRRSTELPRTPEKAAKAGTSKTSLVRRSIGEWESGMVDKNPTSPTPAPVVAPTGPPKPKPKAASAASAAVTESSPERPVYASRVAEARACLNKAKLHLSNSRNLKTDIKAGVIQALDRLYQLVKEAEAAVGKGERDEERREVTVVASLPPPPSTPKECGCGAGAESRKAQEDLARRILEHGTLLKESNERMAVLQDSMDKQVVAASSLEGVSYAGVAAAGLKKVVVPPQATLHSVVVTSRDDMDTGEDVLLKVRAAIDAKEGWVKVDRVRKAKDRKVILGCGSEEERRKVKERLKAAGDRLLVEDIRNKDPLLMLKDVLSYNSDDDIVGALQRQNRELFDGLGKEDVRLEVRFRRKARNPHAGHVVMRVSPQLWRRVVEAEAVHIDLQRVRVADYSPLVQCSLCLGYGHGRRFCEESVVKCSHCGGPHMKPECTSWLANAPPACCNCSAAKLDRTDHNAFSVDCPVRRKWDALARASIAYC